MPRISVIIPTYNRAHLIGETVRSVLNQTFRDFEIIVVDDGSTDGTGEIVGRLDGPIKYIYQQNQGLANARNPGIKVAAGELIAFIDSDDLWGPEKLEAQVELLDRQPELGMVYTDYQFIDGAGRPLPKPRNYCIHPLRSGRILQHLLLFDFIPPSTVTIRRSCLDAAGLFDTTLKQGTDDWDLWLRVVKRYEVSYVDGPLTLIRMHGDNWASEELARGTVQVLLKHLALAGTREALGVNGPAIYQDRYLAVANYYYNRGEMKSARVYYVKALLAHSARRFDKQLLASILKSLMGNRVLNATRLARQVFSNH